MSKDAVIIIVILFVIGIASVPSFSYAFIWVLMMICTVGLIISIIARNKELKQTMSTVPPNELHVLNLDKGGIFRLTGVGENAKEMNLKVISKHLYRQGSFYWYELNVIKAMVKKFGLKLKMMMKQ